MAAYRLRGSIKVKRLEELFKAYGRGGIDRRHRTAVCRGQHRSFDYRWWQRPYPDVQPSAGNTIFVFALPE
jgi:hypothetical protein